MNPGVPPKKRPCKMESIRCSSGVKTKGGRYAHCFYHEKTCKIPKSYHDSPTGKLAGGSTILGHF